MKVVHLREQMGGVRDGAGLREKTACGVGSREQGDAAVCGCGASSFIHWHSTGTYASIKGAYTAA